MPTFAAICPHCSYDFPLNEKEFRAELEKKRRKGDFAESDFASIILGLASVLMAIGAVITFVAAGFSLFQLNWLAGLSGILSTIILAAFSIAFTRILNLK